VDAIVNQTQVRGKKEVLLRIGKIPFSSLLFQIGHRTNVDFVATNQRPAIGCLKWKGNRSPKDTIFLTEELCRIIYDDIFGLLLLWHVT
jgi:hypothetical protein